MENITTLTDFHNGNQTDQNALAQETWASSGQEG